MEIRMSLFENPWAGIEEPTEEKFPELTIQIYDWIGNAFGRKKDDNIFRASNGEKCPRQLWYQKNGYDALAASPRMYVNFILGDLTEHVVKFAIKHGCVGPRGSKRYSEVIFGEKIGAFPIQNGYLIDIFDQKSVRTQVGDKEVIGHCDGYGRRNIDGKWELIEVKSTSNFGFGAFKKDGKCDYRGQVHVYMRSDEAKALGGIDETNFIYLRKETGTLWDRVYSFDEGIWRDVVRRFQVADKKEPPERPYELIEETKYKKPTGRLVAPWQCAYCPYIYHCQGNDIHKDFAVGQHGSHKPIFYKWKKDEEKTLFKK